MYTLLLCSHLPKYRSGCFAQFRDVRINIHYYDSTTFKLETLERVHRVMADLNLSILDAIRTVEHSPHTLSGASMHVWMHEEFEDENPDDFDEHTVGEGGFTDENDIIIIVSGILPSTSEDAIVNYFENSRRSGGGEVSNCHYTDDGEATITFLEVKGMCYSAFCLSCQSTYVL